ncbi:MAG: FixH family protein [Ilyomonas sp.]
MSWGNKLLIAFIGFAMLIGTLVYKSSQQKFDLVSTNYYDDELQYQEKIDGMNNANKLNPLTIHQKDGEVVIQMPAELKGHSITGDVWFYCAVNAENDRKMPLSINNEGIMQISTHKLAACNYTVKISWKADNKNYYKEETIKMQ